MRRIRLISSFAVDCRIDDLGSQREISLPHTQSVQSQVNYYLQPISQSPKASQRQHSSSSRKSKLASIQASNPQPRLHAAFVSSIFHLSTLRTHTQAAAATAIRYTNSQCVHQQPSLNQSAVFSASATSK